MPKLIIFTYSVMSPDNFLPVLTKLFENCQQENQHSIFIKCPIPQMTKPNSIKVAIGDRNNVELIPISTFEKLIAKIRNSDHFEIAEGITYNIPLPLLKHILQKENGYVELNTLLTGTINTLGKLNNQACYNDFIFIYCGEKLGFGVKTCAGNGKQATVFPFYSGEINLMKHQKDLPMPEIYAYPYDLKKSIGLSSIFDEFFYDADRIYEIDAYHFGGLFSFINHENDPCCYIDSTNACKTNITLQGKQILSVSYGDQYQYLVESAGGKFICNIQKHLKENDDQLPKNFFELCQKYNVQSVVIPASLFNHATVEGNINRREKAIMHDSHFLL